MFASLAISKLEELAAEVQTIKDAVAPRPLLTLPPELPPMRPGPATLPRPHIPVGPPSQPPSLADSYLPTPSTNVFDRIRSYSMQGEAPALTPARSSDAASINHLVRPAEPRALGSRVFSGDDINYYFEKYFDTALSCCWRVDVEVVSAHLITDISNIFTRISPWSGRETPIPATRGGRSSFGQLS